MQECRFKSTIILKKICTWVCTAQVSGDHLKIFNIAPNAVNVGETINRLDIISLPYVSLKKFLAINVYELGLRAT